MIHRSASAASRGSNASRHFCTRRNFIADQVARPLDDLPPGSTRTKMRAHCKVRPATHEAGDTSMFTKTMIALVAALMLNLAYVSAHAQTDGRGCASQTTDEGALSAYPAWYVC
jgi:hypothetical protein